MLVKLCLPEADSDLARAKWAEWADDDVEVVVPVLALYEFVSTARQRTRRGLLTVPESEQVLDQLLDLPLVVFDSVDLHRAALSLSVSLEIASAYDAHYLALAAAGDCEFWTADARLYNAVSARFQPIRLLGA